MVFKGRTALKKAYFEDFCFSEDLDFVSSVQDTAWDVRKDPGHSPNLCPDGRAEQHRQGAQPRGQERRAGGSDEGAYGQIREADRQVGQDDPLHHGSWRMQSSRRSTAIYSTPGCPRASSCGASWPETASCQHSRAPF